MEIQQYIDYLKFERRYSDHTLQSYKTDLYQLETYLKKKFSADLVHAGSGEIRVWLSENIQKGMKAKTIKRKISSLKSFYKYLETKGYVEFNPMLKVTSPKIPKNITDFVSETQINSLFDQFEFTKDFSGLRDRLILEMFYTTGIRLSELIEIKHSEISLSSRQIKVTGKGNKQRIIPLLPSLIGLISQYKQEKGRLYPNLDKNYLFITNKGEKLYPKFVYRLVNFYLSKHTTAGKQSPHVLRHTFATHMLNNGADINAIKELLGHASLSATQIYTHNSVEKLKNIYKQAHPKA
ncbi:MAG: tyrosine-type recombinase/integrase [Bacteroidales bacterium]